MRSFRSKVTMLVVSVCMLVTLWVPAVSAAESPGATLVERMNDVYSALTATEQASVDEAKSQSLQSIEPGAITDNLGLVAELWTKIDAKASVSAAPHDLITNENLLKLIMELKAASYSDGSSFAALPGKIMPIVDQLADVAGVSTDGIGWAELEAFLLALEIQSKVEAEKLYFPDGMIDFLALQSISMDELLGLFKKAYGTLLSDTSSPAHDSAVKVQTLFDFYEIDIEDLLNADSEISQVVDVNYAAGKSLLMGYLRTESSLVLRDSRSSDSVKVYDYTILGQVAPLTQLDWTSPTTGVTVEVVDDSANLDYYLRVSLASGISSADAVILGTLADLGTPLDGRLFIQANVTLTRSDTGGFVPPVDDELVQIDEVIDEVGEQLDEIFSDIENDGSSNAALDRATEAAKSAIAKVSQIDVSSQVQVENGTARVALNAATLTNTFSTIKENADKINGELIARNANAKPAEIVVTIDLGTTTSDTTNITIPNDIAQAAIDHGITKIALKVNDVVLTVDVNDLDKSETVVEIKAEDREVVSNVSNLKVASGAYNFTFMTPDGEKSSFNQPVQISIPVDADSDVDTDLLTLAKVVDDGLVYYGGKYNAESGMFSAQRNSFSTYVVVENKVTFNDLAAVQAWAGKEIGVVAAKGIVVGRGDGSFDPKATLTRAEFATMLVKAFGLENDTATESFSDVADGAWYQSYVAAAVETGLIYGRSADIFDPNAKVTRAEMAAMAARAVLKMRGLTETGDVSAELAKFGDTAGIYSGLQADIAFAIERGIIVGESEGTFNPDGESNRAQAAVIIYRLLNL